MFGSFKRRKEEERERLRQELREELEEEIREELRDEIWEEIRRETRGRREPPPPPPPPEPEPEPEPPQEPPAIYGLRSGSLVEVLTMENHLLFVGTVQILKEDLLELREESGQFVPQVEYNLKVKLRSFQRNEWVTALFGQVCGSSADFWRVDRLKAIRTEERREFFRQTVRMEAQVRGMQDSGAKPCRVLDVSAGGALIRCQEEFRLGQMVRLSGVHLMADEEVFHFNCRIQRVLEEESYTSYGCRFMQMNTKEQDRLMRAILVLQRKALQERRNSGM